MSPLEFFKVACKAKRYKEKAWVFSVFGCTRTPPDKFGQGKLYDVQRKDGIAYWISEEGPQPFTGVNLAPNVAILDPREDINIDPSDIPNLSKPILTTVGNYFINWYALVHAFGTKLPFQEGEIKVGDLQKAIRPRFESNILTPDGTIDYAAEDPSKIYVHEYVKYLQCMMALAGFTPVSVPSATPYTAQTSPEVLKRRDELLEEHKDRLHDPATIAAIEKELIALDKEWLDKDPDKGFYIKGKSFNVVRKKLFLMAGSEQSFKGDGTFSLVRTSLSEGLDIQNLPAQINTLRDGSYNRGFMTALGGEAVKYFQRVLQNTKIAEHNCGVEYGVPTRVTAENYREFDGQWMIVKGEALPEQLSVATLKALIGNVIERRSPLTCKTSDTGYCALCMGEKVATLPQGLSAMGASMGSVFLEAFMSAVHGTALQTEELSVDEFIV